MCVSQTRHNHRLVDFEDEFHKMTWFGIMLIEFVVSFWNCFCDEFFQRQHLAYSYRSTSLWAGYFNSYRRQSSKLLCFHSKCCLVSFSVSHSLSPQKVPFKNSWNSQVPTSIFPQETVHFYWEINIIYWIVHHFLGWGCYFICHLPVICNTLESQITWKLHCKDSTHAAMH